MKASAFAPATVANVAVGFDVLGFALKGLGEIATVEKIANTGRVTVAPVDGYPQIPTDPLRNTATAGLVRLVADKKLKFGFHVTLQKSIPVGSGLGGSATSAVAALVAANHLLKRQLTRAELLDYALSGEEIASQARHADNIGPCLEGGLVLAHQGRLHRIRTPRSLTCVVALPALTIHTKDSRASLTATVPLSRVIEQTAHLAGFLVGCMNRDFHLMGHALRDVLIEPQRAKQIPFFYELQAAAIKAGALGCSISGSGPALFALTAHPTAAIKVRKSLIKCAAKHEVPLTGTWISPISDRGAHVLGPTRRR